MSRSVRVWSRFSVNRRGEELKLRIQELPKENLEDIFEFLFKYRVPEEPLHRASKVGQRAEALEEYKQCVTLMIQRANYRIDACYLEEEGAAARGGGRRILGLSIMVLERKGERCEDMETVNLVSSMFSPPFTISSFSRETVKSEEIKTLLNISKFLNEKSKIFEKFDLDAYYKGRGVAVHGEYRGLGIARELFKMREMVCKESGVPLTSAWMSSVGSQQTATRLGWQTACELEYEDIGRQTGVHFHGAPKYCKLMFIRV